MRPCGPLIELLTILVAASGSVHAPESPRGARAAVTMLSGQPDFTADYCLLLEGESAVFGKLSRSHHAFALELKIPAGRLFIPDHGPMLAISPTGTEYQDVDRNPIEDQLWVWAPEAYGCLCESAESAGDTTIAGHPCRRIRTHGPGSLPGLVLYAARDLHGLVIRVEAVGAESGYELRQVALQPSPEVLGLPAGATRTDQDLPLADQGTVLSLEFSTHGELVGNRTVRPDRPIVVSVSAYGLQSTADALELRGTIRKIGSTAPVRSLAFRRGATPSVDTHLLGEPERFVGEFHPNEDGEYEIVVAASASLDRGRTFTRTLSGRIRAGVVHATLIGTCEREDADTDHDGYVDEIRLRPDLDVVEPGPFEISASLEGVTHQRVRASARVDLPAGRTRPSVVFHGENLHVLGTGPCILEAVVQDPEDRTVEYDQSLLDRRFTLPAKIGPPDVIPLGTPKIAPVDLDHDGSYEALVCTFQVELRRPGRYRWVGQLRATTYTDPGYVRSQGDTTLAPGRHTLVLQFDGRAVADLHPSVYEISDFEFHRDGDEPEHAWYDRFSVGRLDTSQFGPPGKRR